MRCKRVHVLIKFSEIPENMLDKRGMSACITLGLLLSRIAGAMYQAKVPDGVIDGFLAGAMCTSYDKAFDIIKETVTCHYEEETSNEK